MIGCITSFNAATGNGTLLAHGTGQVYPFSGYTGPTLSFQQRVSFSVDGSGNAITIQPVLIDGIGTVIFDEPSAAQRNNP